MSAKDVGTAAVLTWMGCDWCAAGLGAECRKSFYFCGRVCVHRFASPQGAHKCGATLQQRRVS